MQSVSYEIECFHRMIQNLEAQEKIPNKNDDLDRDKCKLNRIVANTMTTSSQRPLRLNRSSRRQQRYSWHSSYEQQPQPRKTERYARIKLWIKICSLPII